MNVTIPKVTVNDRNADDCIARTTALNETVNTEAFSSPKSDLVTSSPHANASLARSGERDTGVISVSSVQQMNILNGFDLPSGIKLSLFCAALESSTSFHRPSTAINEIKHHQKLITRNTRSIIIHYT